MQKRRRDDFIVGLTVLLGTVIVIAATLWVKQVDVGGRREQATAQFRDVGNVRVGAAVVLRGVKAGRVEAIELADNGWVEVRLDLERGVQLPDEPVVLLNESSLFGEWQATLMERAAAPRDDNLQRQLAEARQANPRAIPGATLPDIAQLSAVAGRIAGDVADVANRFETAFDDSAARELRASIRNFQQLSANLSRSVITQSRNLDSISRDFRLALGALGTASGRVEQVATRIDSSTAHGEIGAIMTDLRVAAARTREASEELREVARSAGRSAVTFQQFMARGDSVLRKVNAGEGTFGLFVNDPRLYRNSDSLVVQLRDLVDDFRRNPRRYVNLSIF